MLGVNMNNVDAAGNYEKPKAGGYVIIIRDVQNDKAKERLDIEFDFFEGPFKNYYQELKDRAGFWAGRFNKSYKTKALPFFKQFLEAVIASNPDHEGLIIGDYEDVDETKLTSKLVGMVVGEREYIGNDGVKKIALDNYNAQFVSVTDIHEGNYTVPDFKPLAPAPTSSGVVDLSVDGFEPTMSEPPF